MKTKLVWGCLAVFVVALLLMIGATFAHAQQAPITTPQINTDFYVGSVSGFYPSIQNAVTLRCAAAGLGSRVIIPAGSPADGTAGFTISAVTGGCVKVPIIDLRTVPAGFFKWITSAYVLQGTPPAGAAGGDLTGTYPNPLLNAVNSAPGTCGDATHVSQPTINAKGLTTGCTAVVIAAPPAGAAGGDLNGTYPNPGVSNVNAAAVPASSNVLASNAARQLIDATKQGSGTAVQMAAGTTHLVNDLLIYDSGGNAIDSNVLVTNIPRLSTINTWNALNTFNFGVNADSFAAVNGVSGASVSATGALTGGNLLVNHTINNGVGLQVATGPGCTTGAAVLSVCVATINLSPAEPDTAYKVVGCTITPVNGIIGNIGAGPTTTSFTLAEYAGTASGATGGTISCLVVHN